MAKLIDVKGDWKMSYGPFFNESGMWSGKILLEEDGWFEGIVNDIKSNFAKDRMVFGIYHESKVIELFKVSPLSVSNPFIFRAQNNAKGYDGEFSVIKLLKAKPYGICHIITQNVDYLKEHNFSEVSERNLESEKDELTSKIIKFKEKDDFKELYSYALTMRQQLSELALRKYNGEEISTEEIFPDLKLTLKK